MNADDSKALAWAGSNGLRFQWEDDWSVGDHTAEYDCYDSGNPSTCESCVLMDRDGNILASLGCIDDADDDYRREIEGQLAYEALLTRDPESWRSAGLFGVLEAVSS